MPLLESEETSKGNEFGLFWALSENGLNCLGIQSFLQKESGLFVPLALTSGQKVNGSPWPFLCDFHPVINGGTVKLSTI